MIQEMGMSHKNASIWILIYLLLLLFVCGWFVCLFSLLFFCLQYYAEKLLTLTLETLGSKEVARWLVWLQNTKEHG